MHTVYKKKVSKKIMFSLFIIFQNTQVELLIQTARFLKHISISPKMENTSPNLSPIKRHSLSENIDKTRRFMIFLLIVFNVNCFNVIFLFPFRYL